MTRREFLFQTAALSLSLPLCNLGYGKSNMSLPNVILILTDDQGYGDATCYGATDIETPNLDKMAKEGLKFTNYYAPHASCSPSRAGILTGCYPYRVGIPEVLGPSSKIGLNPSETTIADALREQGYRTACIGKWHLGCQDEFLPTNQGFDEFYGLPYSHDMWPKHPDPSQAPHYPDLFLLENKTKVRHIADLSDAAELTTLYTKRAVEFIKRNKNNPFFLYLAHSMPHVPLAVSNKLKGKSKRGLYGDVIMEIDWSVGEIISTLKKLGIDSNTLVIFTSDNGPWLSYGNHAGSAGPFREGKATTFDGGQREICLMRWPVGIPAGSVCDEPAMGIDMLPTIVDMAGAQLPKERIDGLSLLPLLKDPMNVKTPHQALFFHYSQDGHLEGVRSGRWKLHFPHTFVTLKGGKVGRDGLPGDYRSEQTSLELYDLDADPGETRNVASENQETVAKLVKIGLAHAEEINRNRREPGRV